MTSDLDVLLARDKDDPCSSAAVENEIELTISMPCLNEARTLPACMGRRSASSPAPGSRASGRQREPDGLQDLARGHGARVVNVPENGYGSALIAGIRAARGRCVIMGDSDDSYDFSPLDLLVELLRESHQLVICIRSAGGIQEGDAPVGSLHRQSCHDDNWAHPLPEPVQGFPLRIGRFERDGMLDLSATGMEFASEMAVKPCIAEVPMSLSPDDCPCKLPS